MTYSEVILADSPLAYWRLGEATTATPPTDATGHITTAVWYGTPTLGVTGAIVGDANTSIQLAANGAIKTVGTEPSLQLGSGAQSYEVWYRHTGVNAPYLLVSGTNQPEIKLEPLPMSSGSGRRRRARTPSRRCPPTPTGITSSGSSRRPRPTTSTSMASPVLLRRPAHGLRVACRSSFLTRSSAASTRLRSTTTH